MHQPRPKEEMQLTLDPEPENSSKIPSLSDRASWLVAKQGLNGFHIPHGRPTTYLTHGLFRYPGKLPPPLVAYLLNRYSLPNETVIDLMCGGGTTLIEAASSGRQAIGFDINPVARIIALAVSSPADLAALHEFTNMVIDDAKPLQPPSDLTEYYSDATYGFLNFGLKHAKSAIEQTLVLSIARPASFANTKKINTVVDPSKRPKDARVLLRSALKRFTTALIDFNDNATGVASVDSGKADKIPLPDDLASLVILHPPYLTNTAFSEMTELQLALLGFSQKVVRNKELAYRGSYFHVTNGLRKYLVGWAKIIGEAQRIARPGGRIVAIVGDGRIDNVRIPVGTITKEFGSDLGLSLIDEFEHHLNNQTGWTLSRRMQVQHVLVFEK